MGLHAVQFGNNWMKKGAIWLSEEFFLPIISKLGKHVVLFLINYTIQINLQIFASRRCNRHSSKTLNHVLLLFLKCVFVHVYMTSLPSSSSYRSTGNLPLWLFWQFLKKLWRFLKMDSRARCDCRVMSGHGADAVRFFCSDWLSYFFSRL